MKVELSIVSPAFRGCNVWNGSQWKQDDSKSWRDPGFSQDESNPVVCVSWSDAKAFAEWIGKGALDKESPDLDIA